MSAPDVALVTVVALPALVGAAMLVLGPALPTRTAAGGGWLAVLVLAASAALGGLASVAGADASVPFVLDSNLGLTTTGLAAPLLPTVLAVAALVQLAATTTAETRQARFAGLILLFAAAATLTVAATTLPTLLLGWEVMGATSYALIGYRYDDPRHVGSGATAFVVTRAADLGLYLAVAAALAGGGADALELDALADLDSGWRHVAAAGILVAACGKAAQLPFSWWLSRAMDGPSPVSALLHSAAMVALGGYLLLTVSPLLAATGWAADAAAWVGALTAVVLGTVAVVQTDLKQLLAASTAAQLGFVVLAAGLGATSAGGGHLLAHAGVKALLFLAAGAWLEALGTKRLDHLTGVARRWPAVGTLATVAFLALAGLPPLSLWATKDAILAAALDSSPDLYLAGLVATALSAAYATVALVRVLGAPDVQPERTRGEPALLPVVIPFALAPMALAAVGLGILALPAMLHALPGDVPVEPHAWEAALTGLVVVATGGAVVVLRRRPVVLGAPGGRRAVDWLRGWLGLEDAARRLVARPTTALAAGADRLDDRLSGTVEDGVAAFVERVARSAAFGDVLIARAVDALGSGARRAGHGVRRTAASGQLHHYYLQLVGSVLLIVVVLSIVLVGSPR